MGFFIDDKKKKDYKSADWGKKLINDNDVELGRDFDPDIEKDAKDEGKVILKKEELDISKHKSKIGEVEISKEIVTEHKTVNVPVTHEEVIIERKELNNELSDSPITDEDKIHIPVMDEDVSVGKHTVITGEVTARKHSFE
ncbi:MAG: YsnF/AvaK domain-containing protein, partial [Bacillota bacterium]|nr:YsnF/AvaK domain-containing protein [Bacillota bacterium]